MGWTNRAAGMLLALGAAGALGLTGCGTGENQASHAARDSRTEPKAGKDGDKKAHEGWWCEEHGVPEELCSLCMSEAQAKAKFKDKGDWCQIHARARSQCFKCDPQLYAKYEALYEARFDKKPPRPPASEFEK